MSVNLNTFWSDLGVVSGNTEATNQYELFLGLTFSDGFVCASQYDFFTHLGTNRYEFFKSYNSVDSNIIDEYTFYQNTSDSRIYNFYTFYLYAGSYINAVVPTPTPTPTSTATPTPSPTQPAWSPSQLSNLYEWWTTSSGINTSGTDVISWEGYNGNLLSPQSSTYKPTYVASDSDWKSEPSIIINNGDILDIDVGMSGLSSSNVSSKTIIMVSRILNTNVRGYEGFITLGTSNSQDRMSILVQKDSQGFLGYNSCNSQEIVYGSVVPANMPQYSNVVMTYDYDNGVYNFYASETANLTNQWSATSTCVSGRTLTDYGLAIGSYTTGTLMSPPKMSVVEVIAVDGILTPTDYSNLQVYLQNKYYVIPTPTPTPTLTATPTLTPSTPSIDPDAQTYLNEIVAQGGTIDSTITSATDTLFKSLKSAGLYTDIIGMYPILGGVSGSVGLNAVDVSGSYNATLGGGWTIDTSGITGNEVNTYADTHIVTSTEYSTSARPYVLYYTNNIPASDGYQYDGANTADINTIIKFRESSDQKAYVTFTGGGYLTPNNSIGYGCYIFNNADDGRYIYKDGSLLGSDSTNSLNLGTGTLTFGAVNTSTNTTPNVVYPTSRRYATAIYGKNLSASDASTLSTIIKTFNTSLSRIIE